MSVASSGKVRWCANDRSVKLTSGHCQQEHLIDQKLHSFYHSIKIFTVELQIFEEKDRYDLKIDILILQVPNPDLEFCLDCK